MPKDSQKSKGPASSGKPPLNAIEFLPPRAGAVTRCEDTTEAVPLCPRLRLCLKPTACLAVAVDLPALTDKCRSISNWEVMEQLRSMARPVELGQLRVQSSSLAAIRFECEMPNRSALATAIRQLDGGRIKLAGFADFLRVRALELKPPCPTKYDWETFFRDAEGLDATQPGERPDTVRIGQLPSAWFADSPAADDAAAAAANFDAPAVPSAAAVQEAFETFGPIRRVDIPQSEAAAAAASAGSLTSFEAFVQFVDCRGFERCLSCLRGAKLLRLTLSTPSTTLAVLPTLDFDRTGRLSDRALRRREFERRRLEAVAAMEQRAQERARRRLAREEARKREAEEAALRARIAAEERGILAAQRKLQSVRLLGELFRRVGEAKRREAMVRREARLRRKLIRRVGGEGAAKG